VSHFASLARLVQYPQFGLRNIDDLSHQDEGGRLASSVYSLAFRYLVVMLQRSTYDPTLILELSKFTEVRMDQIPNNFQMDLQDAKLAITTYLRVCP